MKKITAIILALALSIMVVACGDFMFPGMRPAPVAPDYPDDVPDVTETNTGAFGPGGTITVWCWDHSFYINTIEEAAKVYKERNPNFELNIVEVAWDDLQADLSAAGISGQFDALLDVFLCEDNAFQMNVLLYPDIFADITDSGINFKEFGPAKIDYSTVDGRNFGVPFDSGTVINCLRTDILNEAGYTINDFTNITWAEYIERGKDVLEKTGKPLHAAEAGGGNLLMIMLQSSGASLINSDGSVNITNNNELRVAMEILKELLSSGIVLEVKDWNEYLDSFTDGSVAGTINGCWVLSSIRRAYDQSGNWAVTNIPRLNTSGATQYSNSGGSSWAVSSSSPNKDLAIDFLANTFAGSVPFYETILTSSGAICTWAPAGGSSAYSRQQAFFADQAVFADIVDFTGRVPSNNTGLYYYEARDAVNAAMTRYLRGASIDEMLQEAENKIILLMG